MTAPTLPSKAERDRLREVNAGWSTYPRLGVSLKRLLDWADAYEDETREAMKFGDTKRARIRLVHVAANLGDSDNETDNEASAMLSALLDGHAPTENRCPRCNTPHDTTCVACDAPLEGPARRALRQLIADLRRGWLTAEQKQWIGEAEAVLAGGQPAHPGPWALRKRSHMGEQWYRDDPAVLGWHGDKSKRRLFDDKEQAKHERHLRGGSLVYVGRPVRDKSTGGG